MPLEIRRMSSVTRTSHEVAESGILAMEEDARQTIWQQNYDFRQAILEHTERTRGALEDAVASVYSQTSARIESLSPRRAQSA